MNNLFLRLCPKLKSFKDYGILANRLRQLSTYYDKNEDIVNDTKLVVKANPKRPQKVMSENLLISLENQFQDQRRQELAPIDANEYKQLCNDLNESKTHFNRKYKVIEMICQTYNQLLNDTLIVPTRLTTPMMEQLIELYLDEDIESQIRYLYNLEFMRFSRKELRKQEVMANKVRLDLKHVGNDRRIGIFKDNNEIMYGLWHNTLFTRINPTVRRDYTLRTRMKTSALFGQKLVIDFSFDEYFNKISAKELLSNLRKMFSFNEYGLREPFDLSFANYNSNGIISQFIDKYFKKKSLYKYYIDFTSDSYLNHYDFHRLCYISPAADEPLREYDPNLIYILPGVVHYLMNPPLSMMRVRQEGIQMKRIPIEDYAPMREDFHLELSNTLQILSLFRECKDMTKAIEYVLPKDVFKSQEECEDEDQEVIKRMFYQKMIASQRKSKVYLKSED